MGSVGSVHFQIAPCSTLRRLKVYGPRRCLVSVNYRVLICCTSHFQSGSLFFIYFGLFCKSLQCLNFHPDTRGQRWSLTEAHVFSCAVGRERHCKQISLACVGGARSAWPTLGLTRSRCMRFPGLHCSGSRVLCRGAVQSEPCVSCIS